MSLRRGDVILARYPDSNLITYKRRPALVVQADDAETGLPRRIVACITSNLNRAGPTRVSFRRTSFEGRAMGPRTDSVVMADNLATLLDREVDRVIGRCPAMVAVDAALRRALAL